MLHKRLQTLLSLISYHKFARLCSLCRRRLEDVNWQMSWYKYNLVFLCRSMAARFSIHFVELQLHSYTVFCTCVAQLPLATFFNTYTSHISFRTTCGTSSNIFFHIKMHHISNQSASHKNRELRLLSFIIFSAIFLYFPCLLK